MNSTTIGISRSAVSIRTLYANLFGITNTLTDNNGNFTVTKNFTAVPHFTIASNTASLNGKFDLFGFRNELTIGNQRVFKMGQYSYVNNIAPDLPGTSNLADPTLFFVTTRSKQRWPVQIRNLVKPNDRYRRPPSTSTINGRCKAWSITHRSCIPRVGWRAAPGQQPTNG